MRRVRYGKYVPGDFGIEAEDLMKALSDFLLNSGFDRTFGFSEWDPQSLDALKQAIERALRSGELFDEQQRAEMMERLEGMTRDELQELLENLVRKLAQEGYLTTEPGTGDKAAPREARFEMTDKSLDFLGFRTLRELMGSLGRASFGAHDTRELATGVEANGSSKPYEFGDTLNIDVSQTLFSAMQREGVRVPVGLDYSDLHVHQSEYQSSCATVVLLDCSHSMILYGEDRFTPAKKVAMALSHLIRTQFPGDSLRCVLFHDSAEEVSISELARVQVGPYHTNTRDGLILAQRLLKAEKKDMKQIVMITDGKPSALTLDDGQIYKNAFGLDPLVISKTLEEVNRCKRQGILVNTFMLASDYHLISFVQKVSELCRGKAYFTTPYTLGEYLLMDFMSRKRKMIH